METLLVFLTTISAGFSAVTMNTRVHVHINTKNNWTDAQSYCRENYKDLSTIISAAEHLNLQYVACDQYPNSWIGLSRSLTNQNDFVWSDGGLPTPFTYWKNNQPDGASKHQDCVEVVEEGWADFYCDVPLPFFCFKSTIMESDKKTWEEALLYCRDQHTDLASLATSSQLQQVESKIVGENFVWVGLRFLAGSWHWLNNEPFENPASLTACPVSFDRCGGRNVITKSWENRNCDNKYSFLCDWM